MRKHEDRKPIPRPTNRHDRGHDEEYADEDGFVQPARQDSKLGSGADAGLGSEQVVSFPENWTE